MQRDKRSGESIGDKQGDFRNANCMNAFCDPIGMMLWQNLPLDVFLSESAIENEDAAAADVAKQNYSRAKAMLLDGGIQYWSSDNNDDEQGRKNWDKQTLLAIYESAILYNKAAGVKNLFLKVETELVEQVQNMFQYYGIEGTCLIEPDWASLMQMQNDTVVAAAGGKDLLKNEMLDKPLFENASKNFQTFADGEKQVREQNEKGILGWGSDIKKTPFLYDGNRFKNCILFITNISEKTEAELDAYSLAAAKYQLPVMLLFGSDLIEMGQLDKLYGMSPAKVLEQFGFLDRKCYLCGCNYIDKDDAIFLANYQPICVLTPRADMLTGKGNINLELLLHAGLPIVFGSGAFPEVNILKEGMLAIGETANLLNERPKNMNAVWQAVKGACLQQKKPVELSQNIESGKLIFADLIRGTFYLTNTEANRLAEQTEFIRSHLQNLFAPKDTR